MKYVAANTAAQNIQQTTHTTSVLHYHNRIPTFTATTTHPKLLLLHYIQTNTTTTTYPKLLFATICVCVYGLDLCSSTATAAEKALLLHTNQIYNDIW